MTIGDLCATKQKAVLAVGSALVHAISCLIRDFIKLTLRRPGAREAFRSGQAGPLAPGALPRRLAAPVGLVDALLLAGHRGDASALLFLVSGGAERQERHDQQKSHPATIPQPHTPSELHGRSP